MAVPANAHPVADPERTQNSLGSADQTVLSGPKDGGHWYGFGPPTEKGDLGSLGPYRVLKQLGKGGMGAVYAAVDSRLDRKLALKVMLAEAAKDADAKERFLREARAAAQVQHDNVVTVYEADERNGIPYIAMQLLQGYPLDSFLKKKGTPTLPQALRLAREAAAGLAAAHRIGLVHRDIKPGNLWLEAPNGRVKVLDFGLAKPVHADIELTQSGMVVGTPAYMSPEQARGARVDARSDLFSLGTVLYRLCANRLPFDGPTTMAVLMALGTDDPAPVSELNPQVPEPLAALIHQLLAKEPDERPQSAEEVVRRLLAIASSTGASQVVVTQPPRVVCVPVSVTAAPETNPFADLGETAAESLAPPPTEPRQPVRKVRPPVWAVVGVAALLALAGAGAVRLGPHGSGPETKATPPDPISGAAVPKDKPRATAAADQDRSAAEWVLSLNGTVRVNGDEREIRSPADLPKDRFVLTGVDLSDRAVADVDLARLKGCQALTHVALNGTNVTDAGLSGLKGLSNLTHLGLARTGITDIGLAEVQAFPLLAALGVQGTAVSDAGLAVAREFPALTHLDLAGTKVTGTGLCHLKGLKGLTLRLDGTALTDTNLSYLRDVTGLVELSLIDTPLTDMGLPLLRDLKALGALDVRKTRATPAALMALHKSMPGCRIQHDGGHVEPFDVNRLAAEWALSVGGMVDVNGERRNIRSTADLPQGPITLTRANLSDRPVKDDDLARLAGCTGLTDLVLHETGVTDAGLGYLKNLTRLQFLSLTGTEVTDAGLARLREHKSLTILHLSHTKVTDAGLAHLANLTTLGHIHLDGTVVSDTGLAHLKGLTDLKTLGLSQTRVIGPGLAYTRGMKRLDAIYLNETGATDEAFAHLSQHLTLRHLGADGTGLTDEGMAHLRKLNGLIALNVSGTRIGDAGLLQLADSQGPTHLTVRNTKVTPRGLHALHATGPWRTIIWSGGQIGPTEADRSAARWALAVGGRVRVGGVPEEILAANELPKRKFVVVALGLNGIAVTDGELSALKYLSGLAQLDLGGSAITDAGLPHLKGLSGLRRLGLSDTKITDNGLNFLKPIPLTDLNLRGTPVTQTGVEDFRLALPGCKVECAGAPGLKK
ncbi:protein kinase [Gemmata sp. JC717]|uniref:protein kinase domain-containing protein n=1 Tax=Gemmata algarum TaxID=2975278 RepID=UPI0021BAE64F|nr:protein kinase [Gemmata algarum]MDY3556311.1 protein kinase [Gemmata algarum]